MPAMASPEQIGSAESGSRRLEGNSPLPKDLSAIQRYSLAVVSVPLALLPALLLQHYEFRHAILSLFLFAIALTAWYAGIGPAALSIVFSILLFLYFFSPPIHSFAFSIADVPAIVILTSFGALIAGFSAVRRRTERQLLHARDELQSDIEERKKAEEKLRRSEAYLAEAERLSKTASWAWSPVTRQSLYWSEEMFRIFEIDPGQGVPPPEIFWERVHPEDRGTVNELMRQAAYARAAYVHEHRIVLPEGTVKYIHAMGRPLLDAAGQVVEYVGTLVDVTERKQAERARQELEEQWRAAFESNPTMYFIVDPGGEIVSVNAFGAEQLGYSVSELVGQPVLSVFYEPDKDAVQKHAKECFEQPGRMGRWEARKIHKDGTMLWVRETANAVVLQKRPVLLVACENITEQKRAEEALRRSEKDLRDLIESIPAMVFVALAGPSNAFVSRGWREYTGLSSEDTAGPGWQSVIHPEDQERHLEKWRVCSATSKPYEDEARFRRASDGEYRWFLVRAVPLLDDGGNVLKWYGILTDIEDRRRAEEALRRSEAYLAEAQRLSKTGSWAWDPRSDRMLYCSEEVYRIFGVDPQQGVPHIERLLERVHLDDRARVRAESVRGGRDKTEHSLEYRLQLPAGAIKYVLSRRHPVFDRTGELVEIMGTIVDVTERKRAEQALQRSEAYLAEAQRLSHTGSWARNMLTGETTHSSEEHSRLFGFDPELGLPSFEEFSQHIHPEDRAKVAETFDRATRERIDFEVDLRTVTPDGTIKHLHWVGHPVCGAAGDLIEYVGTVVDVTERKLAEAERERLRQLQADLARLNRVSMMGELSASIAHEIKQPIAAAVTNAKTSLRWLQREQPDIGEAREALSRIVKDVNRAAEIIDRNRALYTRGSQEREMVDLNQLIREMIALLRDAANRQSISVRADLDEGLPSIAADRVQMQQVFMNLMLNGIEAMKDTGGELAIRSGKNDDGQVVLTVSDFGGGLPVENPERIFDAFFSTKEQGTGMGLSISRRIIEYHGGRLWASDNSGRGATFHFTLPTEVSAAETTLEKTGS